MRYLIQLHRTGSHHNTYLFWSGVVACLAFLCLWDGAGYAVTGSGKIAPTSSLRVLSQGPGGMRTHGIVLLVLSAWLFWSLGYRDRSIQPIRWALIFGVVYSVLVVTTVFVSWVFFGMGAWGGPSKWGLAGTLFFLCALTLPTGDGRRASID